MPRSCHIRTPLSASFLSASSLLALGLLTILPVAAQPAAQTGSPDELARFFLHASTVNGLGGDNLPPWHVKATFHLLEPSGATREEGTFEEYWVSPTHFRRSYDSPTCHLTIYGAPDGNYRSGEQDHLTFPLIELRQDLVGQLPTLKTMGFVELESQDRDAYGKSLLCVSLKTHPLQEQTRIVLGVYCFDKADSALRISRGVRGNTETTRSNVTTFRDSFLPRDLEITRDGKFVLSAHLETIEALSPVDEAIFTPPPDAKLIPKPAEAGGVVGGIFHLAPPNGVQPGHVPLSAGVASGLLLHRVFPVYPTPAKIAGISGTVVLQATISKEGNIENLQVISGPDMLRKAATDAVSQWTYKPYQLNGSPVAVDTTINVVFNLGGSPPPPATPHE